MKITSRPYGGENDFQSLKSFVSSIMREDMRLSYWHVGDLLWGIYKDSIYDPRRNVRLWEDEHGDLLGFGWINSNEVVLQVSPHIRKSDVNDLLEQMIIWGEEQQYRSLADGNFPSFCAFEGDFALKSLFQRHGYKRDEFHVLHMSTELNQPVSEAALPPGWIVRHVSGEDEFEKRVALHREVWSRSKITLESYRHMRGVPGYTPELDLVAVAPDGTFASYCICWLDPVSKIGEFEPVGSHSAFRGKGLGKAVILEGLRRLQEFGMQTAMVCSLGSNVASRRLYESAGFQTYNRSYAYTKQL